MPGSVPNTGSVQSVPSFSLMGSTSIDAKDIPRIGFGTAEYPFGSSNETLKENILQAIKHGYRHFDTAALYETEQPLGEAISNAVRLGLTKSRDELFITSKLWCSDAHSHAVLPALQKTLKNLQMEYLDLYLIHWPISLKPGVFDFPFKKEDIVPIDLKSVWEAMEECQKLGLTKHIGVSNFSCKKLQTILSIAKIPPAVNQVEMSPMWQQKKLREFCKEKGICISAYSPLGAKGTPWGTNLVMDCELLKEIAQSKGKSIAQVCLRWAYEQGVCMAVKSFNEKRMKENLLPQQKGCQGADFVSDDGPYKSLEELWDGEI